MSSHAREREIEDLIDEGKGRREKKKKKGKVEKGKAKKGIKRGRRGEKGDPLQNIKERKGKGLNEDGDVCCMVVYYIFSIIVCSCRAYSLQMSRKILSLDFFFPQENNCVPAHIPMILLVYFPKRKESVKVYRRGVRKNELE